MNRLFRMPAPDRIIATPDQLAMLDLVALRDGQPLGLVRYNQRVVLRRLIQKKLIECVTLGPAIYVLTPVGRIVRARK